MHRLPAHEESERFPYWAGLPWTPQLEQSAPRNLKTRNDSWRTGLSPEVVLQIQGEAPPFFAAHER